MDARKMDQMNTRIQRLVGEIIHQHADVPKDVLVTVTRVAVTPNRRGAEVWLSIYPTAQAEDVAEQLRTQLYELQGFLNRALDSKVVPRIRFTVDYGADHAATIEERLKQLKDSSAPDSGAPGMAD
jgi:ribosome-binding factor A